MDDKCSDRKEMYRLLHRLDDELGKLRKKPVPERSAEGIVSILHCMHDLADSSRIDPISDFTYRMSSCILELERLGVRLDQRTLAYIFVAKLIIQEAFGNFVMGRKPRATARTDALIGSMMRRIDEESMDRNSRWRRNEEDHTIQGPFRPPESPPH